jgi:CRISPR-associated protein (TIGR03986 family)
MITSPYNFVPLSDKVVMPFWAKQVSHDIPFKDSQSGTLKLKIKAESPIYVRNGVPRNASDNDKNHFNQFGNNCFIPGSSIRGMLRSVMEIMSFGRMGNKVNDDKYSVRDFQNNDIYPKTDLSNKVECGWLYKIGEDYFLDQCGKPGRISHKNLDVLCSSNQKISSFYKIATNVSGDRDKSAKSKNENFTFNREHKFSVDYTDGVGKQVYKIDTEGREGEIVMTGQSSVRKEPKEGRASGKHLEFIFWKTAPTKTPVPDEVKKNFFFAYYDQDKNSQKEEDWKWRKKQLENGNKIPVFFRTENSNIKDMGLTMLFKITYNKSVGDSIKSIQKNADDYDLAETIFGYTNDKELSLKGRVQVGHAFVSNGKPTPLPLKTEVLAGPKASYYPNYIEQNPNNEGKTGKYQTFMNPDAKIRGWKRYPVHSGSNVISNPGTETVASKFFPLPASTEFTFDIHYHNLRKEELGALISAITFHNTDGLFHSIGSAKPLGYGKISLSIKGGISKEEQIEMMKAYETYMEYSLDGSWINSPQIKELFAMAKSAIDDKLRYMSLTEFANKKGRTQHDPHFALQKYSTISGNTVFVSSLSSGSDIHQAKVSYQKEINIYNNLKSVEEVKSAFVSSKENKIKTLIEQKKSELLEELNNRLQQLRAEEKAQQEARAREERLARARAGLPAEWNRDMGFDNLANRISQWQNRLENQTISEPFQIEIMDFLKEVIMSDVGNNQRNRQWRNENEINRRFQRIEGWIGEERANTLRRELF